MAAHWRDPLLSHLLFEHIRSRVSFYLWHSRKCWLTSCSFSEGIWELGDACYASVVVTVTFRLALEIHTWTWYIICANFTVADHWCRLSVICTFGSMACWFFWMLLIGALPIFITDGTMYRVPYHAFNTSVFWLSVIMVSMLCIFPVMAVSYYKRTYLSKVQFT